MAKQKETASLLYSKACGHLFKYTLCTNKFKAPDLTLKKKREKKAYPFLFTIFHFQTQSI